jgi:hypothetical protein
MKQLATAFFALICVVALSMLTGCVNSSVNWSPTLSVYNRGGTVGNPTAMDKGRIKEKTKIETEGGGTPAVEIPAP